MTLSEWLVSDFKESNMSATPAGVNSYMDSCMPEELDINWAEKVLLCYVTNIAQDQQNRTIDIPRWAPIIGNEFVRLLRKVLSKEEMDDIRDSNADEPDEHICHTHDHCDANMYMMTAFHTFGIATSFDLKEDDVVGIHPMISQLDKLWTVAWDHAKMEIHRS